MIIMVAAGLNGVLLVLLSIWHLQASGFKKKATWMDTKTFILLLLSLLQLLIFFDFLFNKEDNLNDFFTALEFNLTSISYVFVCYYFLQGAA